ncbi:hypothetical protein [Bradyrhizobium sp. RT9a]|uniref:AbiU2 domain-containing protein n=1 Tax=Bradyrhizobium sp. RT9a TaxID=3156384 RepID=UPI003397774D
MSAKAPGPSDTTQSELYLEYCKKGEIIHRFAENLAQTLGVFHGINSTGKALRLEGEATGALSTILFDQLQIMVIRLSALCDNGTRNDDASLGQLVSGVSVPSFQQFLIDKETQWQRAVGHRAGTTRDIPRLIRELKARWSILKGEQDALTRIKHYRNKVLAHATTGLDPSQRVLIRDIWRLSRLALSVAKYIRLLLERDDWNYLDHSEDGKACGRTLVRSLHRDNKVRGL